MIKKILSYIFPIRLENYSSEISGPLRIHLVNGKKTLETSICNYSYGNLQKILHVGLQEIKFNQTYQRILVLGLGGGSVIETIREIYQSEAFIEAVDIDEKMISISKNEFDLSRFEHINYVCEDANVYVNTKKEPFDLIIVDLFLKNVVPEIFTQAEFLNKLIDLLSPTSHIIYNTMRETMPTKTFEEIKEVFLEKGLEVSVIEEVEWSNDLMIGSLKKSKH